MIIIKRITKNKIEEAVSSALTELGYQPQKEPVLIKPNIVGHCRPGEPYITHYRVVAGIIDYLQQKGLRDIIVAEGPLVSDVQKGFQLSGYTKMCHGKGVKLINLNQSPRQRVKWEFGEIDLPKLIFEAEYINVPKLKTHSQTTVTLGLKNQKGLLLLKDKHRFHFEGLHSHIAALAKIVRPKLTVIDALDGVEGNGPGRAGKWVKHINLIICGTSFVATDATATRLMGIDPAAVKHLCLALEQGVGSFEDEIHGEDLERIKLHFKLPTDHRQLYRIRYWYNDTTCSGCAEVIGEVKRAALSNPFYLAKLFWHGLLCRLDILTGQMEELPIGIGRAICLGDCTKKIAAKHNLRIATGCPPSAEEVIRLI